MQMIPEISTSKGYPANAAPLSFILFITMIKDVYEDYQRHKVDNEENNLPYPVLKDGKFVEMKSADIRVGDIVKVMFFIVFCNW